MSKRSFNQKGVTLIEALIGIFLTVIVFAGVVGAFQLGMKVIGQSKNRVTATAIANGEIEKITNLPYESVGTVGGYPSGTLISSSTKTINNVTYAVDTRVDYVIDSADGIAQPQDPCPNDYKRVEVSVAWSGQFSGRVEAATDIVPKDLIQECATTGGILSVSVFDAFGIMVPSPLIEIKDPATDAVITSATPATGSHYFSLPVASYKIVVSKTGYSTDRTYGTDEVITPDNPHPAVIQGKMVEKSFSIDLVCSSTVNTYSTWGEGYYSDSFIDGTKISDSAGVSLAGGSVKLADDGSGHYQGSGYVTSTTVEPSTIVSWNEFSFSENKPLNTQVLYRVFYENGLSWDLVPDADLPGNSVGFDYSPINLTGLSITTYPKLRIGAELSTADTNNTPTIFSWQISWRKTSPFLIPAISFNLRGAKEIGTDASDKPVYKYSSTQTSNSSGSVTISNLEWDNYTFSVPLSSGLNIVTTNPSPQPVGISPNANVPVSLYVRADNSLLVTVQDNDTLSPIFSASIRVYNNSLGYDTSLNTDSDGQTLFIPLQSALYNIVVSAPGYTTSNSTASVSGDSSKSLKLQQVE